MHEYYQLVLFPCVANSCTGQYSSLGIDAGQLNEYVSSTKLLMPYMHEHSAPILM